MAKLLQMPKLCLALLSQRDYVLWASLLWKQVLIVARERSDGRFSLVGYAKSVRHCYSRGRRSRHFCVYFDLKDMLMYHILIGAVEPLRYSGQDERKDAKMMELISRQMCRYQGSSYSKMMDREGRRLDLRTLESEVNGGT
jgi:hypothetical protein